MDTDASSLLIIGCDATLDEAFEIAHASGSAQFRAVHKLKLEAVDYFPRDYTSLSAFDPREHLCCVVGNEFYINRVRAEMYKTIQDLGYRFTNIVSSQAFVSPSASLGGSNLIAPGAYIGANTVIGSGCQVRGGVQIYPDCKLGNFVTLEPQCVVRESSIIEDYCTLCANTYLMRLSHLETSVYINRAGQYFGHLKKNTFFSPFFEHEVRIFE